MYAISLRSLAHTCKCGPLENSLIIDILVISIRDNGTRKTLLQEKKLTLDRCVDICRASKQTEQQIRVMNAEDVVSVSKQRGRRYEKSSKAPQRDCWYYCKKHEAKGQIISSMETKM